MKKSNSEILKEKLPGVYNDLVKYIEGNYDKSLPYTPDQRIDHWNREDILDIWLRWQGIIGYTQSIMKILDILEK